jgi:Na+-driven multidrug efflux pump
MYLGILATGLYNGFSAFLRAVGDSVTPLIALVISSCTNVGLDLFFVLVLNQGIAGVAFATIISQGISGIYCLWRMHRKIPEFIQPSAGQPVYDTGDSDGNRNRYIKDQCHCVSSSWT